MTLWDSVLANRFAYGFLLMSAFALSDAVVAAKPVDNQDRLKRLLCHQIAQAIQGHRVRDPRLPYRRDKNLAEKHRRICRGLYQQYSPQMYAEIADQLGVDLKIPYIDIEGIYGLDGPSDAD